MKIGYHKFLQSFFQGPNLYLSSEPMKYEVIGSSRPNRVRYFPNSERNEMEFRKIKRAKTRESARY